VALAYDPLGRLRQVSASSVATDFLYDGDSLVAEYSSGGTLLRRYVHGPGIDEPLVWYEGAGLSDRRYLYADERGSIISVTGTSPETYAYGPYGEPDAWSGFRLRYTGQMMLPEASLYHYRARVYDPVLGRFLQTDPVGYDESPNLYQYSLNDPIGRADPNGLDSEVRIYAHEVAAARGHAFFVIRDTDTGERWISRAGPSAGSVIGSSQMASNAGTGGYIDSWVGAFDEAPEVRDVGEANFREVQNLGTFQESGDAMRMRFELFNSAFDAQRNEYRAWDSNSNTYVGEGTRNIFGGEVSNQSGLPLPGVNTNLPDAGTTPLRPPTPTPESSIDWPPWQDDWWDAPPRLGSH